MMVQAPSSMTSSPVERWISRRATAPCMAPNTTAPMPIANASHRSVPGPHANETTVRKPPASMNRTSIAKCRSIFI